jgi:hypothetical protein
LILTIAGADVAMLNNSVRQHLREKNIIRGDDFHIQNDKSSGDFALGDRIIIAKTNKDLGLRNGDTGVLLEASLEEFKLGLDDGRCVCFNPKDVFFKHGYAVTVYKAQAASVKEVFVMHNFFSTRENAYVELSRHVYNLRLYVNKEMTFGISDLVKQFNREGGNIASLNFKVGQELQKQVKEHTAFDKALDWVKQKFVEVGDKLHKNEKFYEFEAELSNENTVNKVLSSVSYSYEFEKRGGEEVSFQYTKVEHEKVEQSKTGQEMSKAIDKQLQDNDNLALARQNYAKWNDDVARIRHELKYKAEFIVRDLFGEPNKDLSNSTRLRFGEKGSLVVDIDGPKAGTWFNFASSKGGDLLALIEQEKGVDFKGALKLAAEYSSVNIDVVQEKNLESLKKQIVSQDKEKMLANLVNRAKDLNVHAKGYLRGRGISIGAGDSCKFVEDMWHSNARQKLAAIIAFAKDSEGKITGAQTIYLDKTNPEKANVVPAKRSFGVIKGSFVEVQSQEVQEFKTNVTILAEGIETALSIKQARVPGKIMASLGVSNFKNYKAAKGEVVIIAADYDGANPATRMALDSAKLALKEQGVDVICIKPKMDGRIGCDFNDVLQRQGFGQIQQQLMPHIEKHLSELGSQKYQDLHKEMSDTGRSGLTSKEVMAEISKTHTELRAYWQRGNLRKDFAVQDFAGQKHTNESSYFLALAQDETVKDLIDYNSDLGKQIEHSAQWQMAREKDLVL